MSQLGMWVSSFLYCRLPNPDHQLDELTPKITFANCFWHADSYNTGHVLLTIIYDLCSCALSHPHPHPHPSPTIPLSLVFFLFLKKNPCFALSKSSIFKDEYMGFDISFDDQITDEMEKDFEDTIFKPTIIFLLHQLLLNLTRCFSFGIAFTRRERSGKKKRR